MELNLTQKQTLKAWLQVNAVGLNDEQAATALNQLVNPEYWAWRTSLAKHDLTERFYTDTDGITTTTFVWGGASGGYINRSQGERDAFNQLFNSVLLCRPSLGNVRTAMDDIFSGAGAGAQANRAHFKAAARRRITVAEQLFVTATTDGPSQSGDRGSTTNPDTLGPEGAVTAANVSEANNS